MSQTWALRNILVKPTEFYNQEKPHKANWVNCENLDENGTPAKDPREDRVRLGWFIAPAIGEEHQQKLLRSGLEGAHQAEKPCSPSSQNGRKR